MSQRALFKAAFLEKLGAPLLASLPEATEESPSEAQQVASLLGRSVTLGSKLSDMLDIKESDDRAESIRVALTATASGLLAAYQRQTGKAPDEAVTKRLLGALETSLTFADNFTAAQDNTVRMETLDPQGFAVDESQLNIQYMNAVLPLIAVVGDFTFGQDEKSLVIEVTEKLTAQSETLATDMADSDMQAAEKKRMELMILKALVTLYTDCHKSEMNRLAGLDDKARMKMDDAGDGQSSMDTVWQSFSKRLAMLKSVAGIVSGSKKTEAQAAQNTEAPSPTVKEEPESAGRGESVPPEEKTTEEGQPAEADNDNPMAFFTKKQAGGGQNEGDA